MANNTGRYARQEVYRPLGPRGQRRLAESSVLIVGAGGLGTALAELLCRAGVGRLRLVDHDRVELVNLHRQHLYTEDDVSAGEFKAVAAARQLRRINSQVAVEPVELEVDGGNILPLVDGMDLILDGTDNWDTRFVINDAAVKTDMPWIFAGVVADIAMTMNILPGETPCLRCVYEQPPPQGVSPTCREVGVLGPAVAVVAGLQAYEAIKLLSGNSDAMCRKLRCIDFWANRVREFDVGVNTSAVDCPCCVRGKFDFLHI